MKQKLKQSKGITLISLVVTIIVLIILAGISLYLVLGENGLIENAKGTKPIVDISSAQERLELVKGPVQLEKYGVNLDDYLEELEKVKEKYEVDDVERIDNDNAEIIIGGKYKFIATDEKNGNVKITYQGEVGGLEISPTSGTYIYPTPGTFEVIKNISGGELSVKSENENIAKASISGTIVTIEPQDMAGTTKIVVTSAAQGKAIYTATVENGTISLEADAYTGNYDGKDHDAVSNVKVTPADATLTYSLNGGEFSSTIPKVNGATTYTIVVKASKAGYVDKTLTKTITIGKNTETGNLVLSASSGTITYPTAETFIVTKNTSGGTLSVTSSDTSVATASISGTIVTITPKAISADGKKTTIIVTSAATSNYEAQTKTYTVTVNRGTITLSADAYTGNYDGKDHDAVSNVKVTPADATLTYSLNGGEFSSTIPKVNGATTYTIVVKASKAGYVDKTLTKTITVGKNTETGNLVLSANSGTITYPTAGTFIVTKNTSGGALSVTSSDTNVATATISGTTVTITPKAISADGKKTTITVTSAATSNYEAQTKTYTAIVNRGTITTLTADAYTGNYDGKDHDAVSNVKVTPADATLTYSLNGGEFSSTIPKVNGATTYTVVVKATKAGYATKTLTKTITIIEEIVEEDDYIYTITSDKKGYSVKVKDTTKTSYGPIKNEINGLPITSLSSTFSGCENMTSVNFEDFDAKNVIDVSFMFQNCTSLTSIDLSNFNTGNVTTMQSMFESCTSLTSIDVSNFNTGNVTTMRGMFYNCSKLTSIDVSNFNTGNVTNMKSMFNKCTSLTSIDLSNFNTENVIDMIAMFQNCTSLTSIDLSNFNTGNVTNMKSMFYKCTSLTSIGVSNFNTGNVTDMSFMFKDCTSLTSINVSNFNTEKVTNMESMFESCTSLTSIDVSNFNTRNVTDMGWMFYECSKLTSIDVSNFNTGNVTDMDSMFCNCTSLTSIDVSNFNTRNVTDMGWMFYGCSKLTSIDLSNFNTGNVTNMKCMFYKCTSLTSIDVSNFNTRNVTDMGWMFYECSKLTSIDLSNFNTGNVTNMKSMFCNCTSLTSIGVSNFNTGNVTDMSFMFQNCTSLTSIDVSNFNTGNVTDMGWMFFECSKLTSIDVSNFNTGNVTNMKSMFNKCTSLTSIDLSNFNTGNVTNMSYMFYGCSSLKHIYVTKSIWTTEGADTTAMFTNCGTNKVETKTTT